jgi:hypothetical protein
VEKVVGEIYKTGAACLGDDAMSVFLIEPVISSPLFVPEQDSAPLAPKKRVTFQEPHREYPDFLHGSSVYKNRLIPALMELQEEDVSGLENAVERLGVKQVEEFRKIELEQTKWWNKKCEQIALTLKAD